MIGISKSYPIFLNENALNVSVTPTPSYYSINFLPPIWNFFQAAIILLSMWFLAKLFWMFFYQVKYGLGDEYLSGKLTKDDKQKLKKEFKGWLKLIKKE